MQSQVEAIKIRLDEVEELIIDIEDKIMENNEAEKKRERKVLDDEGRIREFSDFLKCNNICNNGV